MPRDSKKSKYNLRSNAKDDDRKSAKDRHNTKYKTRNVESSDSESSSDSEQEEAMDKLEYSKFLQKLFPSKHLSKKNQSHGKSRVQNRC